MTLLDQLPPEVVHCIVSHLPTASSIITFSLTSRRLHALISADGNACFRSFVQNKFPTIRTPPYWKEAACLLTTRSRAWERRAFIARVLEPPWDDEHAKYRMGVVPRTAVRPEQATYRPVIDSYETWPGTRWMDKHEVLVWGAAGRLMMRISGSDSTEWHVHRFPGDHLPANDILDIYLLRPEQKRDPLHEEVMVRRANGEVTKLKLESSRLGFQRQTKFDSPFPGPDCMAVSHGSKPRVSAIGSRFIHFFDGKASEHVAEPILTLEDQCSALHKHRQRGAAFLGHDRLAVATQYLETQDPSPIKVYRLRPDAGSTSAEFYVPANYARTRPGRINANVIVPLDDTSSLSGRAGDVFLSGWADGIVRLYDTRAASCRSVDFRDSVDHGQILSLLPIGHERFVAGSGSNSCLKFFDLRMPGTGLYHSPDATNHRSPVLADRAIGSDDKTSHSRQHGPVDEAIHRQLNIFLAMRVLVHTSLWQRLPRQDLTKFPRYRGPVYSLSSPSSTSPTIYAGVANQVLQLDTLSTDDVRNDRQKASNYGFNLRPASEDRILNLSGYERPRLGHESTDTVILRNQVDWNRSPSEDHPKVAGWDERWTPVTDGHRGRRWRGRDA
jgi:hypothetical protein